MYNPQLIKTFDTSSDIAAHRIVKLAANNVVSQATSSTDFMIGVTDLTSVIGSRTDVALSGLVEIEAGASITVGDEITSDANGKAVKASDWDHVIGSAFDSASSGEYVPVFLRDCRAMSANGIMAQVNNAVFTADGAITAKRLIKIEASNNVAVASDDEDALIGVSLANAVDDAAVSIAISGVAEVVAGGSITVGDFVTSDANGKAVTATAGARYIGVALATVSADATVKIKICDGKIAAAAVAD